MLSSMTERLVRYRQTGEMHFLAFSCWPVFGAWLVWPSVWVKAGNALPSESLNVSEERWLAKLSHPSAPERPAAEEAIPS